MNVVNCLLGEKNPKFSKIKKKFKKKKLWHYLEEVSIFMWWDQPASRLIRLTKYIEDILSAEEFLKNVMWTAEMEIAILLGVSEAAEAKWIEFEVEVLATAAVMTLLAVVRSSQAFLAIFVVNIAFLFWFKVIENFELKVFLKFFFGFICSGFRLILVTSLII